LLSTGTATVGRWVLGYERRGITYAPLIQVDFPELAEHGIVIFREFIELQLISAFRKKGVS